MTDFVTGDIVSFPFPYRERPAPYARPCLVLETTKEELLLAYGTSSESNANKGFEIRVFRDYAACGLDKPSRFVVARRLRVHRDDPRNKLLAYRGSLIPQLQARIGRLLTLLDQEFATSADRMKAERRGIHP